MRLYRHFLIHVFLAAVVVLVLCAGVHLAVDPYAIFGTRQIAGFNKVKAVIGSKQRVFEAVELLRLKPQAVILGTSRSDIGIDPQHPVFKGMTSFNAAASGQQIGEAGELLQALLARGAPPKVIVIGLDFMAFNALAPDPFDYSEDNFSPWRRLQLLFSISTTLDSLRTIQRQDYQYQLGLGGLLRDDGFREYIGNPALKRHEQFEGSEEGFLRNTYNAPPSCKWSTKDETRGRDYLESFRSILRLAHANNIDVRMFISPSHARQWETLAASGLWQRFEQWKRDLVMINEEEAQYAGLNPYMLVDFSGYNSITSETVSDDPDMHYYWESSHYRKATGDLVLNRLFHLGNARPDFGIAISSGNIEAWLAKMRVTQAHYRNAHPSDIALINSLAQQVARTSPCSVRNLDHPAAKR